MRGDINARPRGVRRVALESDGLTLFRGIVSATRIRRGCRLSREAALTRMAAASTPTQERTLPRRLRCSAADQLQIVHVWPSKAPILRLLQGEGLPIVRPAQALHPRRVS